MSAADLEAQVAQSVEQRTENPRVGGSIPPLGTTFRWSCFLKLFRDCFHFLESEKIWRSLNVKNINLNLVTKP